MATVTMLRDLWRHRFAVVGVVALSALAGILVLYQFSPPLQLKSRKYTVGVANTRVLIDTPASQVAAIAPDGSGDGTLGMRADLLSRIMVDGTVKAKIAELAGLHPNALFGVSLSGSDLGAPTPPRDAPVLTTQVVVVNYSTQLPLIQIEARAPDAGTAARIADAAVDGLRDYVDQQAADTNVPAGRRVRVTPLGRTQVETAARGPKTAFAVIAIVFVFGFGCAVLIGISAIVRAWRGATANDEWLVGRDYLSAESISLILDEPDDHREEPDDHRDNGAGRPTFPAPAGTGSG